jgi:hypothetical protein
LGILSTLPACDAFNPDPPALTFAMWQYIIKIAVTAMVVVAVSEIAKRSPIWAALLASLPLTSLLALVWLCRDTGDSEQIAALSKACCGGCCPHSFSSSRCHGCFVPVGVSGPVSRAPASQRRALTAQWFGF